MSRPNILLILVDSEQAGACSVNGGPAATPSLERLAAGGVNCPRAWATTPICHPSRSSLITGCYSWRHGMLTNGPFAGGFPFVVRPEPPALPRILRRAGYRTGYAGQMHIIVDGWDDDRHEMTEYFLAWLREQGHEEAPEGRNRAWQCGRVAYAAEATREGRFTARGLELLDDLARAGQPWFMQLDFDAPHLPCWLPDEWYDRYDRAAVTLPPTLRSDLAGRPDWVRLARDRQRSAQRNDDEWRNLVAAYHGSISMVDMLVGRVLDRLDQTGQADNTIVVFTSDHATPVGHHGMVMHGGPALDESVLRVPLLFRWPAGLPAGRLSPEAIEHVDLVPTLLDLAGIEHQGPRDGRSAAGQLRGEGSDWHDESFHVYDGNGAGFFSVRAYRRGPWKLVYTPYGANELYHLDDDPHETSNLAGQPDCNQVENWLKQALHERMQRAGDPLCRLARHDLGGS